MRGHPVTGLGPRRVQQLQLWACVITAQSLNRHAAHWKMSCSWRIRIFCAARFRSWVIAKCSPSAWSRSRQLTQLQQTQTAGCCEPLCATWQWNIMVQHEGVDLGCNNRLQHQLATSGYNLGMQHQDRTPNCNIRVQHQEQSQCNIRSVPSG